MPQRVAVRTVPNPAEGKTGFRGVDTFQDPTALMEEQWRRLRNFVPSRGTVGTLSKRLGSAKFNASAIASVTGIDHMLRAWKADGTKARIIAAHLVAGDKLYAGNDGAGTFAEITGASTFASGSHWSLKNWPLLGKAYAAPGGGTAIQITSDFATRADMAIGAGATDARFGAFLEVFFQRLITAGTPTNPNYIYYFNAGVDDTIGATQFWRHEEPVTAITKNTYGTQEQSLREVLVAFGANTMAFIAGDPATVTIEQASGVIGCRSPKTCVNTPLGLMFLGSDRMIYLIRTDPREPEKVGLAIFPELTAIPDARLIDACAVYHDGFFKLAITPSGSATNTIQWWADLLPVLAGASEIRWYGPHDGLALSAFSLLDATGDGLALDGGSQTAGTVWKLAQAGSYVDGTAAVVAEAMTPEYTEGDPLRQKIWPGWGLGYVDTGVSGFVTLTAVLDAGRSALGDVVAWSTSGALFDAAFFDIDTFGGSTFREDMLNWPQRLVGRSIQFTARHDAATDFRLLDHTRKVRLIPRMP